MNNEKSQKRLRIHNLVLLTIITILTGFLFYCFPPKLLSLVVIGLGFMTTLYLHFNKQNILALATIGLFLGLLFNSHLIPQLNQYTANQKLQELIKTENIDKNKVYFLNRESRALEFYLETRCPHVVWQDVLDKKYGDTAWYYMEAAAMDAFMGQGLIPKAVNCVPTYDINRIQLKFLLPSSRASSLETHCLVQFK